MKIVLRYLQVEISPQEPNMAFAVSLGCESKLTDSANKGTFSIVSTVMANQGALVTGRVVAEITFVSGQTKVGAFVVFELLEIRKCLGAVGAMEAATSCRIFLDTL